MAHLSPCYLSGSLQHKNIAAAKRYLVASAPGDLPLNLQPGFMSRTSPLRGSKGRPGPRGTIASPARALRMEAPVLSLELPDPNARTSAPSSSLARLEEACGRSVIASICRPKFWRAAA